MNDSTVSPENARLKRTWRIKFALLATAVVFAGASCIKAPSYAYDDGAIILQHIGTLLLLIPLMLELRKQRMSVLACVGLFLFTCVHIIGARYLYSNVPYDEWAKDYLNIEMDIDGHYEIKAVGTGVIHGNKFDRLVHFSFGLLMFPFAYQLAKRLLKGMKPLHTLLFTWLFIQTASMVYELFEWFISIVMSPENAEGYNGQQGDMWDAQKDMALALLGSTFSAVCIFFSEKMYGRAPNGEPAGKATAAPAPGDASSASAEPETPPPTPT